MIGMWIAVTVVFWNLENFFDYKSDGVSASEMEFSASGKRRWSKKRFYDKCNGVAKTLLLCGEAGVEGGGVGAGESGGGGIAGEDAGGPVADGGEGLFAGGSFAGGGSAGEGGFSGTGGDRVEGGGIAGEGGGGEGECPVAGGRVTGGGPPDIAGFAEVENAFVVRQLVNSTLLAKLDYGIVHYDSPDRRGIDCALIYRKSRVSLVDSTPCHLLDSSGSVVPTRDLLLARFDCGGDTIAVIVNHHPSKLGGGKDGRRKLAMKRMNAICDSLESRGTHRILCIGDFNDDVWSEGKMGAEGRDGTIKFNGVWEKIDGHFARGLEVRETVLHAPHLLTRDKAFGGLKPLRTYSGPRYLGGLSDHLPVIFEIKVPD